MLGGYEAQWVADNCKDSTSQDDCLGPHAGLLPRHISKPTVALLVLAMVSTDSHNLQMVVDPSYQAVIQLVSSKMVLLLGGPRSCLVWSRLPTMKYVPSMTMSWLNLTPLQRPCSYYPNTFPTAAIPKDVDTNLKYAGWDVDLYRVYFVNGKNDPWREVTVSSDFHPRQSTERQPIFVAEGGFHCSDLLTRYAADASINEAQLKGLAYMAAWLKEFGYAAEQSATGATPLPAPPVDFVPSVSIPAQIVNTPTPTVNLSVVNSGVPASPTSGLKEAGHVVLPNAWARPPVQVEW